MQTALNSLGVQPVAAYTAAAKIDQLTIQPLFAFSAALAAFTAQNYGAKRYMRICKATNTCTILSLSVTYILMFLALIFSREISSLFVPADQLELLLPQIRQLLWIQGIAGSGFFAMLITFRNALQSMGIASIPFCGGLLELLIRGGLTGFMCANWGYPGVCAVATVAWFFNFILQSFFYFKNIHRLTGRFL